MRLSVKKRPGWHFIHDGVEYGPMNDDALLESAKSGMLIPSDEVWRDSDTEHFLASDLEGVFPDTEEMGANIADVVEPSGGANDFSSNVSFQLGHSDTGALTCPYCWQRFDEEHLLFIARHANLYGDPVLGADEPQRFLPSRFTPDGHALDSEGLVCPDIACPRCHMRLPSSLPAMPPLFLSLVGAPGSGKSYLLASMCWKLRTFLPEKFRIRFTDADAMANSWLSEYEESLFIQHDDTAYQSIRKTELRGDLYQQASFGTMVVNLPKPSIFSLQADPSSVYHGEIGNFIKRNLVLYDNAGEHFQPGQDTASDPGTQHLMHSEAIMVLFDPTKSPRFRTAFKHVSDDIQLHKEGLVQRQDMMITETINRVRRHLAIDSGDYFKKPVIVMISKADILGPEVEDMLNNPPIFEYADLDSYALDVTTLLQASYVIRNLLNKYAPEVVAALESFGADIIYMPVSALGSSPMPHPDFNGDPKLAPLVVRPSDIAPKWVEIPLVYTLFKLGFVCGIKHDDPDAETPTDVTVRGNFIQFRLKDVEQRFRIPINYAGYVIKDPESGKKFVISKTLINA